MSGSLPESLAAGSPQQRVALAENLLRSGFLRDGWALFESRWDIPGYELGKVPCPAPRWRGEDLGGRRILVWHEQGLSDTLQMLRFIPELARRGAHVVLAVQTTLKPLAASVTGVGELIVAGDAFTDVDYHCSLLSLPHLLHVRLATIPGAAPYLTATADRVEAWRLRLGPASGFRVGVASTGNPVNPRDSERSIPATVLEPLLRMPGIEFHSLQNHIRPADEPVLSALPNLRMHIGDLTDLGETAALAVNLDLVVTAGTSIAHLAGALAMPAMVLLPTPSHSFWMMDRADSPWYPTMRLIRQSTPAQWQPVIAEVARSLSDYLSSGGRT
jgi:hypothetical protein